MYQLQGQVTKVLDAYQQAIELFESVRVEAGSESGRASFIAQHTDLYARAINLFYNQSQTEEAFLTSERGRARSFLDSLTTGYVQLSDNASANLLAQEKEAYAHRQAAQDALAKAKALNPPDSDLVADLESQLAEAEQAYIEAQAAIKAQGRQLADLVPGRGLQNILSVAEVQELLDENTTLLSYYTLEEQTLIFVITPNSFEVVASEVSHDELTHRVGVLRGFIKKRRLKAVQPAAQELYNLLIAPAAGSLQSSRLAIIPHGPLHYLPFAALIDPNTNQYLIEQHSLVTLPSASTLKFTTQYADAVQNAPMDQAALVLGNPKTGDYDATASLVFDRGSLGPLPFAEEEAEAVARLYGIKPLLGEEATEVAVRQQVDGSRILHIAAHGVYKPEAPLSSLVALAPGGKQDGWLTVGEVYGLELSQTDLVVLSACETNLGNLSAGDELVGLTRAFFFGQTPTVVATLWNVNDESTRILMEKFYRHLKAGVGKADALRLAQLELIKAGGEYAHPYHWSGVVMSGDGGEVGDLIGLDDIILEPAVTEAEGQASEQDTAQLADEPTMLSSIRWLVPAAGVLVCLVAALVLGGGGWWLIRRRRA